MVISCDYLIIGGGIVGMSTAWQLKQRCPDAHIVLVEKESQIGRHQTGHNSGVIHAGVYYTPGSLKAQLCKRGSQQMHEFCQRHAVPINNCGKLIVATNPHELQRMQALYQRCLDNGIEVALLDEQELKALEPNITGLGAIHVFGTSIVNFTQVAQVMAEEFSRLGGILHLNTKVISLEETDLHIQVQCQGEQEEQTYHPKKLISCAGLMADRVAKMLSLNINCQIIPYRGEYYKLADEKRDLVKHLIYPVPDPALPFLGVHLTKMIDGSTTVGPNPVQGWKREGYQKVNIDFNDCREMLSFPGFWKANAQYLIAGLTELKNSLWKPSYLAQVRKYCPSITLKDLQAYPAGIRAQAVLSDGTLVSDFLFAESQRSLHVINAPSPAATSSIAIGEYICQQISAIK